MSNIVLWCLRGARRYWKCSNCSSST